MVIERALEKLKREGRSKGPGSSGIGRAHHDVSVTRHRPQPVQAPSQPRPVIPRLEIDKVAAEAAHVLPFIGDGEDDTSRPHAAYRMLRTRLLHSMRNHGWSTIALTSPGPAEGKSITALNLAFNMARERSREVVLIDLDMRNPSLCRYLGITPPVEIIEYLAGRVQPSEALFSLTDNLLVAGGVMATEVASELLTTDRLEVLLDYIKSICSNPVILLDLPPVLMTDEALLLAPRVDATMLVVGEGRTRRDSLLRAKQLLSEFTMAGVILNRSVESFGTDGYYKYGYGEGNSRY
jgi:Mrp family chromosome partitioning ATPase